MFYCSHCHTVCLYLSVTKGRLRKRKRNSISDNDFGWSCWSINIPKSNEEQEQSCQYNAKH